MGAGVADRAQPNEMVSLLRNIIETKVGFYCYVICIFYSKDLLFKGMYMNKKETPSPH